MIRTLLLTLLLLAGCSSDNQESVALADQEKGVKAPAADLDSLAAMRASSEGGELADQLQEARSLNAQQAYASKEDEPSAQEIEAGAAPAPGAPSFDPLAGASAGTAAPSDLDTLDDEPDKPWINMQLVEQKIRSRDKSMKACWDSHGPGGPGRADMNMTIGTGGRATRVSLASSGSSSLADCLQRTLRNIKYPEPRNGAVSFVYTVKF